MKTIGLCMIVKNEAPVIRRCLDSVRPLVDYVLIADTGSSDDTREIIASYLKEYSIRGEVLNHEWKNFAHNRTEVVKALRKVTWVDYAVVIDADEVFVYDEGFSPQVFKESLSHDLYDVQTRSGSTVYLRPELFSNRMDFHYRSVLHEFLQSPPRATRALATGFHNLRRPDGARARDKNTYHRDVEVLREALLHEQDPFLRSRYQFYLAQSLRDAGELEQAIAAYQHRAQLGYWIEEVFVALYQAAVLMERLERPVDEVLAAYLRAHDELPGRAEALHGAARICRKAKRYEEAYYFAKRGRPIKPAADALFLETGTYDYGLIDEQQISAYWTGRFKESLELSEQLLKEAKFPEAQRQRIEANRDVTRKKLSAS